MTRTRSSHRKRGEEHDDHGATGACRHLGRSARAARTSRSGVQRIRHLRWSTSTSSSPCSSAPVGPSRRPAPGGLRRARPPVTPGPWPPRSPDGRSDVLRRRRDVFTTLAAAAGLTFVLALALGGNVWLLHLLVDAALLGYVALLLQIKQNRPTGLAGQRRLPAGPVGAVGHAASAAAPLRQLTTERRDPASTTTSTPSAPSSARAHRAREIALPACRSTIRHAGLAIRAVHRDEPETHDARDRGMRVRPAHRAGRRGRPSRSSPTPGSSTTPRRSTPKRGSPRRCSSRQGLARRTSTSASWPTRGCVGSPRRPASCAATSSTDCAPAISTAARSCSRRWTTPTTSSPRSIFPTPSPAVCAARSTPSGRHRTHPGRRHHHHPADAGCSGPSRSRSGFGRDPDAAVVSRLPSGV